LVQRFIVEPNELERERTYIEYNITATREAFGMGAMTVREFPSLPELTWQTIAENRPTIENVRLWDVRPLQSTYRQRQNIRQYYDFFDVDVDRYSLDGRYQQVMLAARELDHEQLESAAQTWVNRHLRFTHGYGAVMSPAASLGQDGQP